MIKTFSYDANSRSPLHNRSSAPLSLSTFDTLAEAGRWWPTCVQSFGLNYRSGGGKSCQLHLYAADAKKNAAGNPCHTHKHTLIPPTTMHCMHKHGSPSSTAAIKPHVFSSNTLICSLHTEAGVHINGQPGLSIRFIKAGMKKVTHKVHSPSVSVLHTLEGIQ